MDGEMLKLCPFCGGEASDTGRIRYSKPLADTWWKDGSAVTEAFFVSCIACGAVSRGSLIGGYQTKAEAIAAWNARAPVKQSLTTAPAPGAVEAMREALGQCRDQFAFYAREHLAAAKTEKAATNQRFADLASSALESLPLPGAVEGETGFQACVAPWMQECFGPVISGDRVERGDRLLEETLELLQSGGYDRARVAQLVEYVWGRPAGEPAQEVGGVMVTLAAYCLAHDLDMHEAAETELARIWTKVPQIRAKQATKAAVIGNASPLPIPAAAPAARPSDDDLDPHLPESIRAEKRCGIQRSAWLTGWFVPWSPRNDNQNAEGPWSHWVALAHAILAADATAIAKLTGAE